MVPNTSLESLEHWEDDLKKRYPKPHQKQKEDYRNYVDSPRDQLVRNFYKINHQLDADYYDKVKHAIEENHKRALRYVDYEQNIVDYITKTFIENKICTSKE